MNPNRNDPRFRRGSLDFNLFFIGKETTMATHPESIPALQAEVVDVKGSCSAGHRVGDTFSTGCYDSGGLCGFFYHDIFPSLSVMQFGGKYPWSSADEVILECPDRHNAVTLKITKA
jgi:uncharacterized repeat protein (TIGR04076 family)